MAYDGNGNYLRTHNWTQDAANNINISSTEMDQEDNSIAGAFNLAVTRDGQGKMTQDFLPATDNTLNLGSSIKRWATLNGRAVTAFVSYDLSAAEVTAGITPSNFNYPVGHLQRYGADPTGAANSYAPISQAIMVASLTGLPVLVPPGNFKIDTSAGTLSCSYVSFVGSGVTKDTTSPATGGSVFSIVSITNSPFTIGPGVSFTGIGFYYPAQVDSATPIVFPPTIVTSVAIAGAVNFVYITDCTVFNAYRFFVSADTGGNIGHVFFTNNVIYGILTCYEVTYNAEVIKWIGNNHTFGHFLAATEAGLRGYTRANGTVLLFIRTDGFVFESNMCYGYLNGVNFATAATLCQLANIASNLFDQTRFGIAASGTGNLTGLQVTGNSFLSYNGQNTALAGNAVSVSTSGSLVNENLQIAGNNFSTCTREEILVSGVAPRSLNIASNTFYSWAAFVASGGPYGAMNISGANTSFVCDANNIVSTGATYASGILCNCSIAVISGNLFGTCFNAVNVTTVSFVAYGNVSYATGGTLSDVINGTNIYTINNFWDKASGSSTRPQLRIAKNASQTFATGSTSVPVTFPSVTYDKAGNWNTGTSTWTAKQAARYRFSWMLMHDNTATAGERWTFILTPSSGPASTLSYLTVANYNCFTATAEFDLPNGATVQLNASQTSGTHNLVTFNDGNSNYFNASIVE
jgi:hypothetical protein